METFQKIKAGLKCLHTGNLELSVFRDRLGEAGFDVDGGTHMQIEENLIVVANASAEFMELVNDGVREGAWSLSPTNFYVVAYDGGEVPRLPHAKRVRPYKKPHWMPMLISPNYEWMAENV